MQSSGQSSTNLTDYKKSESIIAPLIKGLQNYGIRASTTLINVPCILGTNIGELAEYCANNKIRTITINAGLPFFDDTLLKLEHPFFLMSKLDNLGRSHQASALITPDTLFTCKRRCNLSKFKPSGWTCIKIGKTYLFHRSHLVGHQFWGDVTNQLANLITGCYYFNVASMRTIEMQIAEYVKLTQNACLYRVTPVYLYDNLLPHGVLMEAIDIFDHSFSVCTYVPNVQPGYYIDYKDGRLCL